MDEVTSTETSPSSNEKVPNDEAPLWQYVTKLDKPPSSTSKSGGNTQFKCNHCGGVFLGSYSRVKAHLLKISNKGIRARIKVTASHRLEMQRMHYQVESELRVVKVEFAAFSRGRFPSPDALKDRWDLLPLVWW